MAWFTIDKALEFLLVGSVGGEIQPFVTADKYLTLITLMFLAFGVAFEFPVLLVFLLLAGVVNTAQLRHSRRWARARDHGLRGGHHPEPGPVLPIVHGRAVVHLLRGGDPDRAVAEAMSPSRSRRRRVTGTAAGARSWTAVGGAVAVVVVHRAA